MQVSDRVNLTSFLWQEGVHCSPCSNLLYTRVFKITSLPLRYAPTWCGSFNLTAKFTVVSSNFPCDDRPTFLTSNCSSRKSVGIFPVQSSDLFLELVGTTVVALPSAKDQVLRNTASFKLLNLPFNVASTYYSSCQAPKLPL